MVACLRLFAVAVICAFSADAVASGYPTTDQPPVVPTTVLVGAGNLLIDVPAVQFAVDQGGTVLLRGTFDFGTDACNLVMGPSGTALDHGVNNKIFLRSSGGK